jgi:hypothetical protein
MTREDLLNELMLLLDEKSEEVIIDLINQISHEEADPIIFIGETNKLH